MRHLRWAAVLAVAVSVAPGRAAGVDAQEIKALRDKAIAFLAKSQEADGSYSARFAGPGITALVVAGLITSGVSPDDPVVKKALSAIEKYVKDNGGIYDQRLANYTTCVAVMGLAEVNKDGRYNTVIKNAEKFLRKLQYGEGLEEKDPKFGGAGYDGKSRPDLSNTQYLIDALIAAGVPRDDPALQKALRFVSRCQNLAGETNDQPFAAKADDDNKGGLVYNIFADPDDKRHRTPNGGLRSVGSMTYARLKSFLYAGVDKEDPRVKGAIDWIRRHYTLDENPGMGNAGLYYYYHTFAKAMSALGVDEFEDVKKVKHDWRKELFETLKKRQHQDGSWRNQGDRTFGEADPNLATAFALLALGYCQGK